MNSKEKGNIGISQAIAYFCSRGYTVSIPLNDSQKYDLIVEIKDILYSVQVKYTTAKAPSGNYIVPLRSISGTSKKVYSTIVESGIDYLFICTQSKELLLIPIVDLSNSNSLTITKQLVSKYMVLP